MFHVILSTVIIPKKPLPLVKGLFCIGKTTRWASGSKELKRRGRNKNSFCYNEDAVCQLHPKKQKEDIQNEPE